MKRELAKYFSCYRNVPEDVVGKPCVRLVEPNPEVEGESPERSILRAIYAKDPITGLPSGDIAAYVSSKTSPEVKQFILNNIMIDTSSARTPVIPDGISDEEALIFSRKDGESVSDYRQRVQRLSLDANQALEYARSRQKELAGQQSDE